MFHEHHKCPGSGLVFMTLASVAMTIPFLCYMRRMANSLERISDKRYS